MCFPPLSWWLLTRWLMPHSVEHLIELAEGTVRLPRLGLVCIHLDGHRPLIVRNWLLALFTASFVVMSECLQNQAGGKIPRWIIGGLFPCGGISIWTYSPLKIKCLWFGPNVCTRACWFCHRNMLISQGLLEVLSSTGCRDPVTSVLVHPQWRESDLLLVFTLLLSH